MMAFVEPEGLFSFANLHQRYLECRRNKRNTFNALRFEARQELNLLELAEALQERRYRPSSSVCFVTQRPKLREIFAADFRDRIVHHVLVHELERYWERVFIHDSYACRKDKGIHKAVDRLEQFIRLASGNGQRRVYYLQLDIANYFMLIDKMIRKYCGYANYWCFTIAPETLLTKASPAYWRKCLLTKVCCNANRAKACRLAI
jgi:hypothetical protein